MNDVLDFLGTLRAAGLVYLWLVFGVATVLLIADLAKGRASRAGHEDVRERKAA